MISIFGANGPKFVFDLGGEAEQTVLLNHWVTEAAEPERKEVVVESELAAERKFIHRGDYWTFRGTIFLWKMGSLTDIRNKFDEVMQFNGQDVALWQHRDGEAYKDLNGNVVLFHFTCYPKHFSSLDYHDMLVCEFRSLAGVGYEAAPKVIPAVANIVMSN